MKRGIVCIVVALALASCGSAAPTPTATPKPPSSSWGASAAGQATSAATRRWQGQRHLGLPIPNESIHHAGTWFTITSQRIGPAGVADWFVETWQAEGLTLLYYHAILQRWRDPKTGKSYTVHLSNSTPVLFAIAEDIPRPASPTRFR